MFRRVIPALLLTLATAAYAAKVTEYSTDMVMLQGDRVMQSLKLYVSGQKSRTEGMMGGQMISIARKDRGVIWMLYPATKTYLEQPLAGGRQPGDPDMASVDLDRLKKEILGRENVLGYACTKMRVSLGNLPNGQPMVATLWVADSLGVPVRLETMGMAQENRNLRPGPQPASLFELPAGYTKTAAPPLPTMGGMPQGVSGLPSPIQRPSYGGKTASAASAAKAAAASAQAAFKPSSAARTSTSTPSSTVEPNTNRFGGDYRSIDMATADPTACKTACLNEAQCKAWTLVKPGEPGGMGYCWLKNSVPPATPEDCCISGVKR